MTANPNNEFKDRYDFWYRLIGIFVNGIAIFSYFHNVLGFKLGPFMAKMILTYSLFIQPIGQFFVNLIIIFCHLIKVDPPNISADIVVVYLVLSASYARTRYHYYHPDEPVLDRIAHCILEGIVWPFGIIISTLQWYLRIAGVTWSYSRKRIELRVEREKLKRNTRRRPNHTQEYIEDLEVRAHDNEKTTNTLIKLENKKFMVLISIWSLEIVAIVLSFFLFFAIRET